MSAIDQADNVDSPEQARALRDKFLAELAKPSLSDERAYTLSEAIDLLEAQWPELQESDMEQAEKRSGRNRRRRERYQDRKSSRSASSGRRRRGSSRTGGRTSRGRSGGLVGPRVRGYYRRTGIPAAAGTATDIALSWVGGTIGLILLYLFIANRRGNRALTDTINAISGALSHFVSPLDPLSPPSQRAAQKPTGGRTAHPPPRARAPTGPGSHRRNVGSHVGGG